MVSYENHTIFHGQETKGLPTWPVLLPARRSGWGPFGDTSGKDTKGASLSVFSCNALLTLMFSLPLQFLRTTRVWRKPCTLSYFLLTWKQFNGLLSVTRLEGSFPYILSHNWRPWEMPGKRKESWRWPITKRSITIYTLLKMLKANLLKIEITPKIR